MVGLKLKNNFCFKKLFFSFTIFFLLFSLPKFVWASTNINSNLDITEDTVWTKEAGPYLISADISVESNVTLKIESGTEIQFKNGPYIYLWGGNLDVDGNNTEKVSFSADFGDYWGLDNFGGKIRMNNSELSDLEDFSIFSQGYVDITSSNITSTYAMNVYDHSFLSIDGGSLSVGTDSAIYSSDGSKIYLSNTEISSLGLYSTILLFNQSEIHTDKVIFDYSIGSNVLEVHDSTAAILNSKFEGGLGDGIVVYQDDSSLNIGYSNLSDYKGIAVKNYNANVFIKESDFFQNGIAFSFHPMGAGIFSASKNNIIGNNVGAEFNPWGDDNNFDLKNNFWGDASGPYDLGGDGGPVPVFKGNPNGLGDSVHSYDDMFPNYSPWLVSPATHAIHNPVIIIPGILSSYLNKEDGTEVWPNILKALEPFGDTYLDDLILGLDGKTSSTTINTPDIMRETKIPLVVTVDFFQGLITKLKEQYTEGEDLFVFPYDWRLDIDYIAKEKLSLFIENILEQTGSAKVDIIAHSMGGLVTKSYIKNFGGNKIGKFIDIATPHLGAPDSLKILSYGDDLGVNFWGFIGLNIDEIKKISQNFPSVYELLPSEKYFTSQDSDYKYYLDDLGDTDSNGVKGKLGFSETMDFLKNSGRNSLLIDQAREYQEVISDIDPQTNGIETINIVGCGTPTIGKIFTLPKKDSKNEYAIGYIDGDGTVPLKSAEALYAEKTYYISGGIAHGTMPSSQGVKDLVSSVLFGKDIVVDKNIDTSNSNCKLPNGKYISVHSPIKIDVYDEEGNHSGLNDNGYIEQNIPGVIYDAIEDNKFVFIPDGENYKINLQATGLGSFSVDVKTEKEGVDQYSYFDNIPIESISFSGNIDLSSTTPMLIIKNDKESNNETLLPDISSNIDLNETERVDPIQTVSTSTFISITEQNPVSRHSQGTHGNLLTPVLQILSPSPQISVLPNTKILISSKNKNLGIFAKVKLLASSSNLVSESLDNSNLAGANSVSENLKSWSLFKKITDYKNIFWNFILKMFRL